MSTQYRQRFLTLVAIELIAALLLSPTISINNGADIPLPALNSTEAIGPVSSGVRVEQQFNTPGGKVASIGLLIATYQRANVGKARVTIRGQRPGESWETLTVREIPKAEFQDNAIYALNFNPALDLGESRRLSLTLEADGTADQAIAWWSNTSLQRPGYQLSVNDKPHPGIAHFTMRYVQVSGPIWAVMPALIARLTIFLDPLWQALLLVGATITFGALSWGAVRLARLPTSR